MARPPPVPQVPVAQEVPNPRAANPISLNVLKAVEQVGEPIYERFRRQKSPRFDGTHDAATVEEWIKLHQHIFGYIGLTDA